MARGGSGSKRARSIVALSANRRGNHGSRPRDTVVQRKKQRTRRHYELGRTYRADVFYRMAHAYLYLLCAELVGVPGCWRDHVPDWYLARLLSLGPLTMDEDTKLVLQMWRVQVMVNDHLQRRVDALERELGYTYVAQRFGDDWSNADWRPSGRNRRRNDDSDD